MTFHLTFVSGVFSSESCKILVISHVFLCLPKCLPILQVTYIYISFQQGLREGRGTRTSDTVLSRYSTSTCISMQHAGNFQKYLHSTSMIDRSAEFSTPHLRPDKRNRIHFDRRPYLPWRSILRRNFQRPFHAIYRTAPHLKGNLIMRTIFATSVYGLEIHSIDIVSISFFSTRRFDSHLSHH